MALKAFVYTPCVTLFNYISYHQNHNLDYS